MTEILFVWKLNHNSLAHYKIIRTSVCPDGIAQNSLH